MAHIAEKDFQKKIVTCQKRTATNTLELKKDFHNLIDSIDNESLLSNFYVLLKRRISGKEEKLWNELTKKEREELNLAFEESEKPENLISHDKMRKIYDFLDILSKFPEIGTIENKEKGIRGFTIIKQVNLFYRISGDKVVC